MPTHYGKKSSVAYWPVASRRYQMTAWWSTTGVCRKKIAFICLCHGIFFFFFTTFCATHLQKNMSTSFFMVISIYRPRKVFTNFWVEKKVLKLFASQNLRSTVSWPGLATSVLGMVLLFLPASRPGAKCYVIVPRITVISLPILYAPGKEKYT